MSVVIDTVNIGGSDDQRIVLTSGSSIARPLSVGSSWTRLVLGIRWAVDDPGTAFAGLPYYFGLMANPDSTVSNGPASATCTNFVGIGLASTYGYGSPNWTREPTANPLLFYNTTAVHKKVGASATLAVGAVSAPISGVPTAARSSVLLMFEKSGANMGINYVFPQYYNTPNTCRDVSHDLLLETMYTLGTNASCVNRDISRHYISHKLGIAANLGYTATIGSVAVDEATYGYFNSVVASWGGANPLRISEISSLKIK